MSFMLGVAYKTKEATGDRWDWEYLTSSASHMMDVIDKQACFNRKVYAIKTPTGDVYDCKTGKWAMAQRNKNLL